MQKRAINIGHSSDANEGYIISSNCKLTQNHIGELLKVIMKEIKAPCYAGYAALKYPGLFHKYEILEKSLDRVGHHDLVVFYKACESNLDEL